MSATKTGKNTKADNSFRRFFVAFRVCVAGFLEGCRPILGLDACHLKSKYLGMLLSAVTLDGNNTLFVVAFVVVETESKGTWCRFLENLQLSFGVQVEPLAFISDMEKGLAEATKQYFPHAEHRVCLRQLWKNVKKQFQVQEGHTLRNLFWSAANAYTEENFIYRMSDFHATSPGVFSYLVAMPYLWSKSQFSAQIKSTVSTNNMAESFNAWITEARNRPAVDLIDTIRAMLMDQRAKRNMKADTWHGPLTPYAEDYIREITNRQEQFIVRLGSLGSIDSLCSRCGSWGHHRTSCKNPIGHTGQRGGFSASTSQMSEVRSKLPIRRAPPSSEPYEDQYVNSFLGDPGANSFDESYNGQAFSP